jgi:hypothetical protein
MIVARTVNTGLQCYNAWTRKTIIDPVQWSHPENREGINFDATDNPTEPKYPYPPSSGMDTSARTAKSITGAPGSLA